MSTTDVIVARRPICHESCSYRALLQLLFSNTLQIEPHG
jgi:hypothetical protein